MHDWLFFLYVNFGYLFASKALNFSGITLPHIYLSPTLPPNKPYFASKLFLEDGKIDSSNSASYGSVLLFVD